MLHAGRQLHTPSQFYLVVLAQMAESEDQHTICSHAIMYEAAALCNNMLYATICYILETYIETASAEVVYTIFRRREVMMQHLRAGFQQAALYTVRINASISNSHHGSCSSVSNVSSRMTVLLASASSKAMLIS